MLELKNPYEQILVRHPVRLYLLLTPPLGRHYGGWGYLKMKMKIIIEIQTIENPRMDLSHVFRWYNPSSPPWMPLLGLGVPLNENKYHY